MAQQCSAWLNVETFIVEHSCACDQSNLGSASAMQWMHNAGGWVHVNNNSNDDADDYHRIKHACDVM